MARLSPKQLADAQACPGEVLVWSGQAWTPSDILTARLETQQYLIRLLIQTLQAERIDLPPELEEYADV